MAAVVVVSAAVVQTHAALTVLLAGAATATLGVSSVFVADGSVAVLVVGPSDEVLRRTCAVILAVQTPVVLFRLLHLVSPAGEKLVVICAAVTCAADSGLAVLM